jgi:hypothetical protein
VHTFCVFVDFFAGNVLNVLLISNKKNNGHPPLTASFWSELKSFEIFTFFVDDKLAVKTILRAGGQWFDVKFELNVSFYPRFLHQSVSHQMGQLSHFQLFRSLLKCFTPLSHHCHPTVTPTVTPLSPHCHPHCHHTTLSPYCHTTVTPLPRHCHTTVTLLSHHCHPTVTTLSPYCHTTVTPLSHHRHTTTATLSHHCRTPVTPLSHHCHTTVTPRSHHCHATVTPLHYHTTVAPCPPLSGHTTVTPLSHHCHTTVTPLSHHGHTTVTPLSHHCQPSHHFVTPLSRAPHCHTTVTPLSHTITPLVRHCHTTVTLSFRRLMLLRNGNFLKRKCTIFVRNTCNSFDLSYFEDFFVFSRLFGKCLAAKLLRKLFSKKIDVWNFMFFGTNFPPHTTRGITASSQSYHHWNLTITIAEINMKNFRVGEVDSTTHPPIRSRVEEGWVIDFWVVWGGAVRKPPTSPTRKEFQKKMKPHHTHTHPNGLRWTGLNTTTTHPVPNLGVGHLSLPLPPYHHIANWHCYRRSKFMWFQLEPVTTVLPPIYHHCCYRFRQSSITATLHHWTSWHHHKTVATLVHVAGVEMWVKCVVQ